MKRTWRVVMPGRSWSTISWVNNVALLDIDLVNAGDHAAATQKADRDTA